MAIKTALGAQRYNNRLHRIFDDARRLKAGLDVEFTPVIFRRWKDGDIIALFPTHPGTCDPSTCSSFMHVGQHGSADLAHVINSTSPAKPEEYADLFRELESPPYGYRLKLIKRHTRQHFKTRRAEIAR